MAERVRAARGSCQDALRVFCATPPRLEFGFAFVWKMANGGMSSDKLDSYSDNYLRGMDIGFRKAFMI